MPLRVQGILMPNGNHLDVSRPITGRYEMRCPPIPQYNSGRGSLPPVRTRYPYDTRA
jgi:hypothetical protein